MTKYKKATPAEKQLINDFIERCQMLLMQDNWKNADL